MSSLDFEPRDGELPKITNDRDDWVSMADGEHMLMVGKLRRTRTSAVTITFSDWGELWIDVEGGIPDDFSIEDGTRVELEVVRSNEGRHSGLATNHQLLSEVKVYEHRI